MTIDDELAAQAHALETKTQGHPLACNSQTEEQPAESP